ncbi:MAG: SCO family protein [Opitutaceae bacterium]|nr:SCO family protein [Verrucomicrobiales bacterium]
MKIVPVIVLNVALVGCGQDGAKPAGTGAVTTNAAPPKTFLVKGVVKSINPDGLSVTIQHEEIPDYMPAMTMPFDVKDRNELTGIAAGDAVSFRLLATEDDGWIDQVKKTSEPVKVPEPRPLTRRVREVDPLSVGDTMPNYPFTNELGKAVSLADFKGNAVAFTFIFTRCPFPDFCPRLSQNFAGAFKQLKEMPNGPKNWKLLSISFDPEFDTPKTLRAYAERYKYDPGYWSFLTGELIEIDAITEQFGLMFPRSQEGVGFDHNLRTVVIDAQGKVQAIFKGSSWKAEELVTEMVTAAGSKPK